jgi:hypothetical protein
MNLLQRGRDNLLNGTILGGLFAAAIIWGGSIYGWMKEMIPLEWLILGELSLPVYLLGIGALVGYIIDRK